MRVGGIYLENGDNTGFKPLESAHCMAFLSFAVITMWEFISSQNLESLESRQVVEGG